MNQQVQFLPNQSGQQNPQINPIQQEEIKLRRTDRTKLCSFMTVGDAITMSFLAFLAICTRICGMSWCKERKDSTTTRWKCLCYKENTPGPSWTHPKIAIWKPVATPKKSNAWVNNHCNLSLKPLNTREINLNPKLLTIIDLTILPNLE